MKFIVISIVISKEMKDSIGEFDEYLTEHVCTPMTGKYYLYT